LFFRWLPDCVQAPADRLRNALLWMRIQNVKHRLQLRKPALATPLLLNLEETTQEVSFNSVALPQGAPQLELLEVTGPAILAVRSLSRRVRGDDWLRLSVQNGPPAFELRLQLKVDGDNVAVRVEPCLVDSDGEVTPLTIASLNAMQKELPMELRRTERELTSVRKDRPDLEARIARMGSRAGQANSQLTALRASLGRLLDRERTLAGRIPALQQRVNALPDLVKLADLMHHKTQLRFRVFLVSGSEDVILLGM
jgi:hypothetical protein